MERRVAGVGPDRRLGWLAWPVGAALGLGLLLRLWFVVRYAWIAGDALVYGDIARNLLEHRVYGFSEMVAGVAAAPRPTLIRLPGYSLFLAVCFRVFGMEHYGAVLLVQGAVDLWTCLLLGGVAARIFGRRAGRAAVWLGALCPFTANYTAAPLTETLTLFCMALVFYGLVRWGGRMDRWVFALGLASAYAVLLRPEQGMLAAVVVPAMVGMVWRRAQEGMPQGFKPEASGHLHPTDGARNLRGFAPVAVVALLTALPLGPWAVRNWRVFHVLQPLAPRYANDPGERNPAGFQRWYRTWAIEFASTEDVYWKFDGLTIDVGDLPDRAFDSQAQLTATTALLADYNKNTSATPELDDRFNALAQERIGASPLRYYVALPLARVVNMMLRPRTELLPVPLDWWRFRAHWKASLFAAGYAGLNLAYLAMAGMMLARPELWRGNRVPVWAMMASVGLRAALLLTLDNSEARYTLEFFPVLIVLGTGLWAKQNVAAI